MWQQFAVVDPSKLLHVETDHFTPSLLVPVGSSQLCDLVFL